MEYLQGKRVAILVVVYASTRQDFFSCFTATLYEHGHYALALYQSVFVISLSPFALSLRLRGLACIPEASPIALFSFTSFLPAGGLLDSANGDSAIGSLCVACERSGTT